MILGIVEGFYGRPWDILDRISMVEFIGGLGLNAYIYGPKEDPRHRERWRTPYPDLSDFALLAEAAWRRGVDLFFALSPGLDVDYSSRADVDAAVRKLTPMAELGYEPALFFDDIPPIIRGAGFRSLAQAQSQFVNRVLDELGANRLIFCPTYYWGFREGYLREIGESLDSKVLVMWTGPHIVPPRIKADDVDRAAELLGRRPVIWDNYPVNDYFLSRGVYRLHMGPFKGREKKAVEKSAGYVLNPMPQSEASKMAVYTFAEFLRGNYNEEAAAAEASERLAGAAAEAFLYFVRLNSASPLDPDADYVPTREDAGSLKRAVEELRRLKNRKLLAEISPVLDFLESLASALPKPNPSYPSLSPGNVQAAGHYEPPLSDVEMADFFGAVIRRRPWWLG